MGVDVPTLLEALRAELPDVEFTDDPVAADAVLVAVGDRSDCSAGHLGRGVRRGRPRTARGAGRAGRQDAGLRHTGRAGAAVGPALRARRRRPVRGGGAGVLRGQEGGPAVAGVLSGGRPVGAAPGERAAELVGQPWTYLAPPLGQLSGASNLDPTPLFAFGHGLSYTTYDWQALVGRRHRVPYGRRDDPAGDIVRNTGSGPVPRSCSSSPPPGRQGGASGGPAGGLRAGAAGGGRVGGGPLHAPAGPGRVHRPGRRPDRRTGELESAVGASSAEGGVRYAVPVTLTGPKRMVGRERRMRCEVRVK